MSRNAIIAVVAVVLVGGAGWYFYSKGATSDSMTAANPQAQSGGMQSLKDLIAANISQQCTYTEPQSGTHGTMYIAGGKIRGDFTSNNVSGHMISDGKTVNTWMDGQSQGYTMAFTASEHAPANNPNAQQGVDPDKKTDYKCTPWSSDQSKFELPSGIKFMDMSAMMQQAAPSGAGASAQGGAGAQVKGTAAQCSACDSAPAAYRTQCRAALHC